MSARAWMTSRAPPDRFAGRIVFALEAAAVSQIERSDSSGHCLHSSSLLTMESSSQRLVTSARFARGGSERSGVQQYIGLLMVAGVLVVLCLYCINSFRRACLQFCGCGCGIAQEDARRDARLAAEEQQRLQERQARRERKRRERKKWFDSYLPAFSKVRGCHGTRRWSWMCLEACLYSNLRSFS